MFSSLNSFWSGLDFNIQYLEAPSCPNQNISFQLFSSLRFLMTTCFEWPKCINCGIQMLSSSPSGNCALPLINLYRFDLCLSPFMGYFLYPQATLLSGGFSLSRLHFTIKLHSYFLFCKQVFICAKAGAEISQLWSEYV